MNEERVISQVLEREVNFGVISGKPRQRGLELITLANDPLVLAVPLGHPWAGKTLRLNELKGASFVLRSTGSETRRLGELALRVAGLTYNDLQVVAEVDSSEAVALAVEQGLGVGFISEIVVTRFLPGGKLATAKLVSTAKDEAHELELEREVNLVRLAPGVERGLSPTQERFWEFLHSPNARGKSDNFHRE
jgi:DNA-binding transcriptional LysR family regulator